MKYLILLLAISSPIAAESIPNHMIMTTMAKVDRKAQIIADVTVDYSLDGHKIHYIGANGEFTENYMLHSATIDNVQRGHNIEPNGNIQPVLTGDRIFVRQWGNLVDKKYEGVPRLIVGKKYRLYMYDAYETEESTGTKIYGITGLNAGQFMINKLGIYRSDGNSTTAE